ncbi:phosphotransferase [Nocardia brasiliensis]|uniref:phosphotransferase n=1 Tax=Nocardia brasiliensis TaxID=37326 RepID=UPI001895D808|nr:phosphotransferase [Nocardia brasiliensis]MBF6129632.1 phosphotransferase [Nocardia brasiliensis]
MPCTNGFHAPSPSAKSRFDALMAASGLSGATRPLNERTVRAALRQYFGRSGHLTRIPTEKDDTFVFDDGAERLLVKVSGAQEATSVVHLQTAVLCHIAAAAPDLPIPALLPGIEGAYEYDLMPADTAGTRVLRVMKFLPGSALSENRPTAAQLAAVGRMQAAITNALAGFAHPAQDRTLAWDLRYFPALRPLLDDVADLKDRRAGERIFEAYAGQVQDRVPGLHHQVVHGDFSAHNVLVDAASPEYVCGVIDFGDTGRTAELFDVAIAVSNQLDAGDDPWRRGLDLLTGYLSVRPLDSDALALLPIAAAARSLQRALIAQWRARRDPARADYVLSHAARDWMVLRAIGAEWTPVLDRIHSISDSSSKA